MFKSRKYSLHDRGGQEFEFAGMVLRRRLHRVLHSFPLQPPHLRRVQSGLSACLREPVLGTLINWRQSNIIKSLKRNGICHQRIFPLSSWTNIASSQNLGQFYFSKWVSKLSKMVYFFWKQHKVSISPTFYGEGRLFRMRVFRKRVFREQDNFEKLNVIYGFLPHDFREPELGTMWI